MRGTLNQVIDLRNNLYCENTQKVNAPFFQQPVTSSKAVEAYHVPSEISFFLDSLVQVPTHKISNQAESESAQLTSKLLA